MNSFELKKENISQQTLFLELITNFINNDSFTFFSDELLKYIYQKIYSLEKSIFGFFFGLEQENSKNFTMLEQKICSTKNLASIRKEIFQNINLFDNSSQEHKVDIEDVSSFTNIAKNNKSNFSSDELDNIVYLDMSHSFYIKFNLSKGNFQ